MEMNKELIMYLAKALELALPEGMSVVVGGSANPSTEELANIIRGLADKITDSNTSSYLCDCDCHNEDNYPDEDESDYSDECERWENGDCDCDNCNDCPYGNNEEPEEDTDELMNKLETLFKRLCERM